MALDATASSAIRGAAQSTGTSFSYLLATAKIESGLNPKLTMKSSSAAGLFQFIDQTWLGTLKQAGPAFGYGAYSDAISRTSSGRYVVSDPQMRREIMQLRNDPTANATMAGVFTQQNAAQLSRRIGRAPTDGELYIAHFFGPGGAGKLIEAAGSSPQANAADMFPAAAHANRPIFYDKQGNARSVSGVYAELVRRYNVASNGGASNVASSGRTSSVASAAPSSSLAASRASRPVIDTAGMTQVFAAASVPSTANTANGSTPQPASSGGPASSSPPPSFNSLFSDPDRRMPVSPVVAALWSMPASNATSAASIAGPIDASGTDATFNLFQDAAPKAHALFAGHS